MNFCSTNRDKRMLESTLTTLPYLRLVMETCGKPEPRSRMSRTGTASRMQDPDRQLGVSYLAAHPLITEVIYQGPSETAKTTEYNCQAGLTGTVKEMLNLALDSATCRLPKASRVRITMYVCSTLFRRNQCQSKLVRMTKQKVAVARLVQRLNRI